MSIDNFATDEFREKLNMDHCRSKYCSELYNQTTDFLVDDGTDFQKIGNAICKAVKELTIISTTTLIDTSELWVSSQVLLTVCHDLGVGAHANKNEITFYFPVVRKTVKCKIDTDEETMKHVIFNMNEGGVFRKLITDKCVVKNEEEIKANLDYLLTKYQGTDTIACRMLPYITIVAFDYLYTEKEYKQAYAYLLVAVGKISFSTRAFESKLVCEHYSADKKLLWQTEYEINPKLMNAISYGRSKGKFPKRLFTGIVQPFKCEEVHDVSYIWNID
jgi:hypothetical protein